MANFLIKIKSVIFGACVVAVILGCSSGASHEEEKIELPEVEGSSRVLFQAFSWESQNQSKKWWNIVAQNADEIKDTFEYVWLPPISDSNSQNGYLPRELTNYSTAYGTEEELKAAITAIKPAKAIGDMVLNHRCGTTSWGDFTNPSFGTVKGENYQAICSDDEGFTSEPTLMGKVAANMRGAKDTGDGYSGGRDIDHTNATVQKEIIEWMNSLKEMGFAGWRYDYVRGYAGKYVGYYNAKSEAEFSVGELWPNIYSAADGTKKLVAWVNETKESVNDTEGSISQAFDFSLKYVLNNVFGKASSSTSTTKITNSNYGALGNEDIFFRKYPGYAVTFVDNHDTGSTQNQWAIDLNDVGTAYVMILTHPGTPCVAWQHYLAGGVSDSVSSKTVSGTELTLHDHIKFLVKMRKSLGITNTSAIEVLKANSSTYAAKITGTAGSVVVSIGSSNYGCPEGFTAVYSGTNFIIYTENAE